MKEKQILFSAPMVRALLAGTKTQTRRVVKTQFGADAIPAEICATTPQGWQTTGHSGLWWDDVTACIDNVIRCPYGQPGDRLWVRETWAQPDRRADNLPPFVYLADFPNKPAHRWKPSIYMPRAASRITLEVTSVRVERLQDISEADCIAEGIEKTSAGFWSLYGQSETVDGTYSPRTSYRALWESINGPGSWKKNPWVWAVEFKRVEAA